MPPRKTHVERKKVLLMGKSGAGKTSMRSIIFSQFMANEVHSLGVTMEIEHSNVRLLGNLTVNLWDCGGQEQFMDQYFKDQKENIFSGAAVLIYVLDIMSEKPDDDLEGFKECLNAIAEYAENSKVFVLVHKMDLLEEDNGHPPGHKQERFEAKCHELKEIADEHKIQIDCSKTSIWDKTLYSAWSKILTQLVPNRQKLQGELRRFVDETEADEVMLFEKNTFLNICYQDRLNDSMQDENELNERLEELSHHMKTYKMICSRNTTDYTSFEMRCTRNTIVISEFTEYTFIMVVSHNPQITTRYWRENIKRAKPRFDRLNQKTARR